ncbi:MAG: DUF4363 family protein [Oscillospiraceae bacterium]|jgi:hypothetical protein|nr:DUF4363 family protein [Oscillospiraceae bacterium]
MKRKLRTLIIIAAVIIGLELGTGFFVRRESARFETMLDGITTAAQAEDLIERWRDSRGKLEMCLSFDDAEEIYGAMVELRVLLEEGESASSAREGLRLLLVRIREKRGFTLKNFL